MKHQEVNAIMSKNKKGLIRKKGESKQQQKKHMMKRPVFEMYKGHSASLYRSGCVHRIIFDATAHYVLFIRKQ